MVNWALLLRGEGEEEEESEQGARIEEGERDTEEEVNVAEGRELGNRWIVVNERRGGRRKASGSSKRKTTGGRKDVSPLGQTRRRRVPAGADTERRTA